MKTKRLGFIKKVLQVSLLLSLSFSGVTLAQLLYLPGSEFGKAVFNIPMSSGFPQPLAFFGSTPLYEDITTLASDPRFARIGRSVGRLDLLLEHRQRGSVTTFCTATLIAEDRIITTYHCVPGFNLDTTIVEAQLRMGFDSFTQTGEVFRVNPVPVEANATLDYAILSVEGRPGRDYGFITLDVRAPQPNEALFLIHHSLGRPKMVTRLNCAILTNETLSARLRNPPPAGNLIRFNPETDVLHHCDAQAGSSGALMFALSDNRVVGLHFAGTDESIPVDQRANLFKRIDALVSRSPLLRSLVTGAATAVTGATNAMRTVTGANYSVQTETFRVMPDGQVISSDSANSGDIVEYRITITNTSGRRFEPNNLIISSPLPPSTRYCCNAMMAEADFVTEFLNASGTFVSEGASDINNIRWTYRRALEPNGSIVLRFRVHAL